MSERPFSAPEAAERLGIGKSTLYQMVQRQEVPHHRFGNRVVFTQEDIDQIIADSAVEAKPKRLEFVPKRAI